MSGMRGNIYIKNSPSSGVYLHTAKDGQKLPKLLKDALLRGKGRWGDTATLSRVIFGEMIQRDILTSSSAYGISTTLPDNENFILVVDDQKELIGIFDETGHRYKRYTFEEFVTLEDRKLEWVNMLSHHFDDTNTNHTNANRGDPYPLT